MQLTVVYLLNSSISLHGCGIMNSPLYHGTVNITVCGRCFPGENRNS